MADSFIKKGKMKVKPKKKTWRKRKMYDDAYR